MKWSQLREIDAGLMDSLTYEYVAAEMPQEYEARKKDKLRYRWVEAAGCCLYIYSVYGMLSFSLLGGERSAITSSVF